jgi:hypothetical protein
LIPETTVASIDTQTLIDANQNLSASVKALDAYIAGTVRSTDEDVKQLGDITAHALLFVHLVQVHSGAESIDEMLQLPIAKWPDIIREIAGVAAR